eukprot:scaffold183179_cov28-Prasinocladus_malaysianus.AAC.1
MDKAPTNAYIVNGYDATCIALQSPRVFLTFSRPPKNPPPFPLGPEDGAGGFAATGLTGPAD